MRKPDETQSVANFIRSRLSALSQADILYISGIAQFAIDAADYINSLLPGDDIDIEQIPVNGNLFGDDTAGKRLFWSGEWNIPGTSEWYQFSGTLADVSEFDQIAQQGFELASGYIERYPKRWKAAFDAAQQTLNIRLTAIERGF